MATVESAARVFAWVTHRRARPHPASRPAFKSLTSQSTTSIRSSGGSSVIGDNSAPRSTRLSEELAHGNPLQLVRRRCWRCDGGRFGCCGTPVRP